MSTLSLASVSVAGRGRLRLAELSLTLSSDTLTVVVGPNGAGKSSLIRTLAGLLQPDEGRVTVDRQDVASLRGPDRAAHLAWLPQHPRPEEGLTAREVVASARFRFREPWPLSAAAADEALAALDATTWADRPMTTLSGGEAQRVRLASLVAQEASWWLLDEPANHLDPAVRLDLLGVVRARAAAGTGVVLVTHDLMLLSHLAHARVVALDRGRVAWDGTAGDPALPEALGSLLGLELARVPVPGAEDRLVTVGRRP